MITMMKMMICLRLCVWLYVQLSLQPSHGLVTMLCNMTILSKNLKLVIICGQWTPQGGRAQPGPTYNEPVCAN